MKILDLPIQERPREKLTRYGVESLSNVELLAVIIGSGTKTKNVMDIAYDLLKEKGLLGLFNTPYKELEKTEGISKVNSMKLASIFELSNRISRMKVENESSVINADYIFKKYQQTLMTYHQEVMGLIVLDKRSHIIAERILYKGTNNNIYTSSKDILREIFVHGGSKFYIFHNHHGDSSFPSDADITFTIALIKEAKRYDLELVDHVIISRKDYFSFKEANINI